MTHIKLAPTVTRLEGVTRLDVILESGGHGIDESGRKFSRRDCTVELSVQDSGRTLKVFVIDNKA